MRRTAAILVLILVLVSLLASLALAKPASANQVNTFTGGYHFGPGHSQFAGESEGFGYHLRIPGAPSLTGNGCCCAHLPCVRKP